MKKNDNKIDSVKLMREIRDRLSEKYLKYPEQEMKDLEIIRKKYNLNVNVTDDSLLVS